MAQPLDLVTRRRWKAMDDEMEGSPAIYHSANFLKVDMDVLRLLNGDWKVACFLAKVLDYQQLSNDDGWVYHSWPQWEQDYFSRAEVERCVGLLQPLGLQVEVRDHGGRLTRHYRVDVAILQDCLSTLQESYRVDGENDPSIRMLHIASKSDPVKKSQGAINQQEPCKKVAADTARKSQGLLGSDLLTRSQITDQQTSDANASAAADAPVFPKLIPHRGNLEISTTLAAKDRDDEIPSDSPKSGGAGQTKSKGANPANRDKQRTQAQEEAYQQNLKIARHFRTTILGYCPTAKVPKDDEAALQRWIEDIRLTRERDGRTPHDIRAVIDFLAEAPSEQPWNLSPKSIRKNFDGLMLKRRNAQDGGTQRVPTKAAQRTPATRGNYTQAERDAARDKRRRELAGQNS